VAGGKIKIGLVEIGDAFGGEYYFPYSVGILRAYAEKNLASGCYEFLPIIYKCDNAGNITENLSLADIVFFSAYLWNFKANLEIARNVKRERPDIIIAFGGPQVPESKDKLTALLQKYPFIDIASFGEGEKPFLRIIEGSRDRRWEAVPSVGCRGSGDSISINMFKETIRDLNEIPSPYLSGVFDELMKDNPEEKWQGRIETNRGCPFTCAFCYWGKQSERKIMQFDLDRIYREIDWFSSRRIEFVFCCDGNFGILKRDAEIARKVAENKKKYGFPKVFSVQNTKNSREEILELQKVLKDAGLQKGVNLALQSLNGETLRHIGRSNIDNRAYIELQKLLTQNDIPTFTDLIIGLPGETYQSFTNGVAEIMAGGQHNRIQFINLTVLENTLMADPEYQKKHGLKIVETELIPHHSSLDEKKVVETQFLVTATLSMPERDWRKARIFSWMASLLHFDKMLQIPFVVLHTVYGAGYKDLIEAFMKGQGRQAVLAEILSAFEAKASGIQAGDSEYDRSEKWLNITWYPDELMLIRMSAENRLEAFYREAEERIISFAKEHSIPVQPEVISDAVRLNRSVFKQPFVMENAAVKCGFNIWEIYQGAIRGERVKMKSGSFTYSVDRTSRQWTSWAEWCREVVWFGNKTGDYIYPARIQGKAEF
jgi:radical SAM superfamily enzyme YgiQ (UPF0313 family)